MSNSANTDHPIHALLELRWSPYGFSNAPIEPEVIRSLFEAARWAPSSYNEQPWHYIVATQDEPEAYEKLLSVLVEPNQAWAKNAPVLALGVISNNFARNGKSNRAAVHDLGLASGNLVLEATARGLCVHQMIGLDPEKAREIFAIPEGYEAYTALAIGYKADANDVAEELAKRDAGTRERKPLHEFVFGGQFGQVSDLVK
mgnify:CR=1 FL=1